MKCNLCGGLDFRDLNKRSNAKCANCGSLERTRLLFMYLQRLNIESSFKVLHLAPEPSIYRKLSALLAKGNYQVADKDPKRYSFAKECKQIDLTEMEEWPSNAFDIIIHVHVLEHIPCNVAYPLFHLHRMLKKGGTHLCVIPFSTGVYDECFNCISDAERIRRFGQFDHVRRFGRDGLHTHLGKILNLPPEVDATKDFSISELRDAGVPESHWYGFHIGTVLRLRKEDFLLDFSRYPSL